MKEFRNLWNRLLTWLYPDVCPFCGRLSEEGVCEVCRKKIRLIREPRCKTCGKPLDRREKEYCADCLKGRHAFREGRSLFLNRAPVSTAIYAFKYQNRRIYGRYFGKMLADEFGDFLQKKKVDCIVPVPLHRRRRRVRGYNQAEILALELGRRTGIPVEKNGLLRVKNTKAQKDLDPVSRKQNMKGAFARRKDWTVPGTVLLVDDIYTTGSTLDEAARTLLSEGAENVYFLTISIGQGY